MASHSHKHKRTDPAVISFKHMRQAIGCLALALPVLTSAGYALFGAQRLTVLDSISEYYYTMTGGIFVGTLCMVALFLIAYKGYDDWEDRVFNFAAVLAQLVAFFSMNPEPGCPSDLSSLPGCQCSPAVQMDAQCPPSFTLVFEHKVMLLHYPFFRYIHFLSAGLLFIILGYVSFYLFTRTVRHRDPHTTEQPTRRKHSRNSVYRACGIIIWTSLSLYVLYSIINSYYPDIRLIAWLTDHQVLFIVEWICLWAFGFSWLVKGEGVNPLNDRPEDKKQGVELAGDKL